MFRARCYGPRRSIFGPVGSLMELNMRAKVQGRSSNVTYLPHGSLVHGGQVEIRFLAPNFLTDKRPRVYFGPLLGGRGRTSWTFF